MNAWLLVGFVFAVLWLFWISLGTLFDALSEWHAAARRREDVQADGERGD